MSDTQNQPRYFNPKLSEGVPGRGVLGLPTLAEVAATAHRLAKVSMGPLLNPKTSHDAWLKLHKDTFQGVSSAYLQQAVFRADPVLMREVARLFPFDDPAERKAANLKVMASGGARQSQDDFNLALCRHPETLDVLLEINNKDPEAYARMPGFMDFMSQTAEGSAWLDAHLPPSGKAREDFELRAGLRSFSALSAPNPDPGADLILDATRTPNRVANAVLAVLNKKFTGHEKHRSDIIDCFAAAIRRKDWPAVEVLLDPKRLGRPKILAHLLPPIMAKANHIELLWLEQNLSERPDMLRVITQVPATPDEPTSLMSAFVAYGRPRGAHIHPMQVCDDALIDDYLRAVLNDDESLRNSVKFYANKELSRAILARLPEEALSFRSEQMFRSEIYQLTFVQLICQDLSRSSATRTRQWVSIIASQHPDHALQKNDRGADLFAVAAPVIDADLERAKLERKLLGGGRRQPAVTPTPTKM